MAKTILLIDDELSIRKTLKDALEDEDYQVSTCESGIMGLEQLKTGPLPDVVILDIWMPEMDGLETLKRIKQEWAELPVIMMSGHGTIETAVKATKLGAFDYAEKPLSLERILMLIQNAAKFHDLKRENVALRKQVQRHTQLLGESPAMRQVRELIARIAPTTGSVLITGENGTGKELVAHQLHALSPRCHKPFIEVNCAAIPEELIESELFGHEKGAFTGATQMRRGRFDLAHGGTLFLDEIGDMSLKAQAKVLRILQEQKFERVGGTQTLSVDVRMVAATNKDLKTEIQKGSFREDLFYRLNVIPFFLPPLRERKEDILLLARHFLEEFAHLHAQNQRVLSLGAGELLCQADWPGNVRELKNLIERLVILSSGQGPSEIHTEELAALLEPPRAGSAGTSSVMSLSSPGEVKNLKEARNQFEKEYILQRLRENDWNVSRTAQILGVERSHLHRKLKLLGVEDLEK